MSNHDIDSKPSIFPKPDFIRDPAFVAEGVMIHGDPHFGQFKIGRLKPEELVEFPVVIEKEPSRNAQIGRAMRAGYDKPSLDPRIARMRRRRRKL